MKYNLIDSILRGLVSGVCMFLALLAFTDFFGKSIVKTSDPVQEVLKDSTPETLTDGTEVIFGSSDYGMMVKDSAGNWHIEHEASEWNLYEPDEPKPVCRPKKRKLQIDTCRLIFVGTQGIKVTRIGDSIIIGFETIEPPVPDHRGELLHDHPGFPLNQIRGIGGTGKVIMFGKYGAEWVHPDSMQMQLFDSLIKN